MAEVNNRVYLDKIRWFLQNSDEAKVEILDKFIDRTVEQPSLVDEISRTINALKINSLLGKTDISKKQNELKKVASKVLNESKKKPHLLRHPVAGQTQNLHEKDGNKTNEKLTGSSSSGKLTQKLKMNLEKLKYERVGNDNINPIDAGFTGKVKQYPDDNGNNLSNFRDKWKQKTSEGIHIHSYGSATNINNQPSYSENANHGHNNFSGNQRSRGSRGNRGWQGNRGGRSTSQARGGRGHPDNIPELMTGFPRSRKDSNASDADSVTSENRKHRNKRNLRRDDFQGNFPMEPHICPLCFASFPGKPELGLHLQNHCPVVQEGSYKEVNGFTLLQILDRGMKCNLCKTTIEDHMIEKHKKDHQNDHAFSNVLVNIAFCATCSDFVPVDIILYHRSTAQHMELLQMRQTSIQRKICVLRQNFYCMVCKNYPSGRDNIQKHISSERHASRVDSHYCEFWCYPCGLSIESNVNGHILATSHQNNASRNFHCVFCSMDFKLMQFVAHLSFCISGKR